MTPHLKQTQSCIYLRLHFFIYPQVNRKSTHVHSNKDWHMAQEKGKLFVAICALFALGSANINDKRLPERGQI